jgi:hypothetical protein
MGGSSRVVAEAPLNPATPALGDSNSNSNNSANSNASENSTNNSNNTATPSPTTSEEATQTPAADTTSEEVTADDLSAIDEAATIDLSATTKSFSNSIASAQETLALAGPASFPGVDGNGLPTGFTIHDTGDYAGAAVLKNFGDPSYVGMKTITESIFATNDPKNVNIILDQFVTFTGSALQYSVVPTVRINGVWQDLLVVSTNTRVETQADGTKLIIATMFIDPSKTGSNNIKAPAGGRDADKIPAIVTVRLHVTPMGQTILGQAVQVLDPFTSAGGAF